MGVLGCDEQTALCIINELGYADQVAIACYNSPVNITVSGEPEPIDATIRHAHAKQIFARGFNTGKKAYHSKHMAFIGERYEDLIAPILQGHNSGCGDSITMTSTLLARTVNWSDLRDPKYWRQNLEKPVLFSQAMALTLAEQDYHVVEIGPHSTFKLAILDISTSLSRTVQYSPTLIRNMEPTVTIMQLAGSMFLDGFNAPIIKINGTLSPFASGNTPVVLKNLPPYPWSRDPVLWSEGRISCEYRQRAHPRHELLGSAIVGGSSNVHSWRNMLKLQHVPWIRGHRLGDTIVFPAAGYIAMVIEAFRQTMATGRIVSPSVTLRDIKFLTMLTLDVEDEAKELFTELCPIQNSLVHPSENKYCFTVSSFTSNISTIHCRGIVEIGADTRSSPNLWSNFEITTELPKRKWYNTMRKEGLNFGSDFQLLDGIKHARDYSVMEVVAACDPAPFPAAASSYPMHPTRIDSLFQACIISTTSGRCNLLKGKIPVSIDMLTVSMESPDATSMVRACSTLGSQHTAISHAVMFDGESPLLTMSGLQIVPWLRRDLNYDVVPRDPFLEKVWMPERDLKLEKNGLEADGTNGPNGAVGQYVQRQGLLV